MTESRALNLRQKTIGVAATVEVSQSQMRNSCTLREIERWRSLPIEVPVGAQHPAMQGMRIVLRVSQRPRKQVTLLFEAIT